MRSARKKPQPTFPQRPGRELTLKGWRTLMHVKPRIFVLTVPFEGHAALLKELNPHFQAGSILIDATVPLAASVGGRASRTLGLWQGSAAQETAELVPEGISVVAAFQNISADALNGDADVECDVIVCSDDKRALELTSELAKFPACVP